MHIDVKVKPSASHCRLCLNIQQEHNQVGYCSKCPNEKQGVMINTLQNLLGAYATVKYKDGTLENVPIHRVKVMLENG